MDTIDTIMRRRSVRKFTEKKINKEDIMTILRAGQAGPSACNKRPWQFLVIEDKNTLLKMAECHGQSGNPLKNATLAIMVLGDESLALDRAPLYWCVDSTIAVENMILAATSLGIGSVWLGTWPQNEKIEAERKLFNLPANVIPQSVVAFGYPEGELLKENDTPFEENKVHFEKW